MRNAAIFIAGLAIYASGMMYGTASSRAQEERADLSGTWKLDPSRTEPVQSNKDLTLVIEDKADEIRVKETRGPDLKDDVTEFTCGKYGTECALQDGRSKASVTVYYNGPALVTMKTRGRKGSSVEKRRYTLTGDTLVVEVTPIDPAGRPEKLVFTKAR
jgi:hypothetical protein